MAKRPLAEDQHPHASLQPSLTPVPEDLAPSSQLCGHLARTHTPGTHVAQGCKDKQDIHTRGTNAEGREGQGCQYKADNSSLVLEDPGFHSYLTKTEQETLQKTYLALMEKCHA